MPVHRCSNIAMCGSASGIWSRLQACRRKCARGKSTLLRCTNGLELIDEGEIALDGTLLPREWNAMRRVRQRMGMVFQNFELFPHKTVLGNVTVGPITVLRMPRKAAE